MLYYIILYYIILHHIIVCYITSYYILLYSIILLYSVYILYRSNIQEAQTFVKMADTLRYDTTMCEQGHKGDCKTFKIGKKPLTKGLCKIL